MRTRVLARGLWAAQVFGVALLSSTTLLGLGSGDASAASSDYGGFTWSTDRSEPQLWEVLPNFAGRDDVLHIQTYPTNPAPNTAGFYQTEGRYTLTNNPVGQSFISGDIYIADGLQTSNGVDYVNMGMWGVVGLPPAGPDSYPVINFYNGGTADPANPPQPMIQTGSPTPNVGEIRVFDSGRWIVTTGANAVSSAGTINYGGWNNFRINYVPGATPADGRMDLFLNGVLIQSLGCGSGSNTCADFSAINPATDSLYSIILNSRTNGNSAYDVYWSNIMASTREEYYDAASIAPSAIVAGDMLLGTYVDRRGLDWDGGKTAWMHGVAGNQSFDYGAGTLDSSIAGAQFGLDLLALGDPSSRAGVTFGYSSQSTNITLPDGMTTGGSTSGSSPSIGGYLTHADSHFYADLLSQYRFINYDVNAPSSTGTVSGGAVDVAAEAGLHFGSGAITVTPLAQLSYQHLTLDPTTLGGLDVDFGSSDALIGRARLLVQANLAGLKVYASGGVSSDLIGDKKTTVEGMDFATNIGGTRGEVGAGFEANLAHNVALFGSGEYGWSFDGDATTYAGRAGFRAQF